MTSCDRFETEGLLHLEQGLSLDDHFATCPDCLEARAAYERLTAALATAGQAHEPPPFWESRVWAAIEARRARRRRSWWTWWLVPAGLTAALLVVLVPHRPPGDPNLAALEVEVEAGQGTVRRGEEAHPGDRLVLRANAGAAENAELRVYRNDSSLVLQCSIEPPCERAGAELRAALVLDTRGTYQTLLLLAEGPLPTPGAGLDRDASAALAAGAEVVVGTEIQVR